MPDFSNILTPLLMAQMAHTMGHYDKAGEIGVPISQHALSENWHHNDTPTQWVDEKYPENYYLPYLQGKHKGYRRVPGRKDPLLTDRAESTILGGGFEMQDELGRSLRNPDYSLANAVIKAAYMAGSHRLARNSTGSGDIRDLERSSGNRAVNAMLGATVASDLYHYANPENNASLSFNAMNGTPGLMLNVPLDVNMKPVWKSNKNAMRQEGR